MNIRLEENHIRFRVSPEESETLVESGVLHGQTGPFKYAVRLDDENDEGIYLKQGGGSLLLCLPRDAFQEFKKTLPSRKGLCAKVTLEDGTCLEVSLQVDVHGSGR